MRTDPDSGVEESIWFDGEDRAVFTCFHRPPGTLRAGAVLCPPLLRDFVGSYSDQVALARKMAAAGVGVLRFHYRGTGNSFGSPTRLTATSAIDDARRAIDTLYGQIADRPSAQIPSVPIALVGSRLGALVAAAAARTEAPGGPLALLEPKDVFRYVKEGMRAVAMQGIKEQRSTSARSAEEVFADGDTLDLLGYRVTRELYDSFGELEIERLISDAMPRPVLVVQDTGARGACNLEQLSCTAAELGGTLEVLDTASEQSWWFADDAPSTAPDLGDHLTDFIRRTPMHDASQQ